MRPRGKSAPFRHRTLRLLVFACFFHFSGINNGYTTLATISPLDAGQSVTLTASLLRGFSLCLLPQRIAFSVDSCRLRLARVAAVVGAVKARSFARPAPPSRIGGEGISRAGLICKHDGFVSQAQSSYLKEKYLKETQEPWVRQGGSIPAEIGARKAAPLRDPDGASDTSFGPWQWDADLRDLLLRAMGRRSPGRDQDDVLPPASPVAKGTLMSGHQGTFFFGGAP